MKAALAYWTKTGNTEKVANAIKQGLIKSEVDVSSWKIEEADDHNFLDYDLYCIGFPSYSWHTPEPVTNYLKEHHRKNAKAGLVNPSSPRVPRKYALVFVLILVLIQVLMKLLLP
jgi:menaquinone-dependent protoporphyrinogen IX oxidase